MQSRISIGAETGESREIIIKKNKVVGQVLYVFNRKVRKGFRKERKGLAFVVQRLRIWLSACSKGTRCNRAPAVGFLF